LVESQALPVGLVELVDLVESQALPVGLAELVDLVESQALPVGLAELVDLVEEFVPANIDKKFSYMCIYYIILKSCFG
jgi:hypothetical protein